MFHTANAMSGGVEVPGVEEEVPKMKPTPMPPAVEQYISEVTNGTKAINQYLVTVKNTEEMLDAAKKQNKDVFLLNTSKSFPFLDLLRATASWTQFDDPEDPMCKCTLVVYTDKKYGKFFFLVRHAELMLCILDGRPALGFDPAKIMPNTTVKTTLCMPYTCKHCGNHATVHKTLSFCGECAKKGIKFYYCGPECQKADYKVHKALCDTNKNA